MFWYSWLLLALFVICSLFLIGSVLLQSGKGDLASALGGGAAQSAFGPRSAASTLARVTLVASVGFMILAFMFSLPNILGGGSVATELDKDPLAPKASPIPLASPLASPAPISTGQTNATPAPAVTPSSEVKEDKSGAKADDKAKPVDGKTPKADASTGSKDTKPVSK